MTEPGDRHRALRGEGDTLAVCESRPVASTDAQTPICDLRNLGPSSARVLQRVGIETRGDLEAIGVVHAWIAARQQARVSLNLLYAMHGALTDTRWTDVAPEVRARLRAEVDRGHPR